MANTKYGYAESSDLRATNAGHIRSVVHSTKALENGMLVKIGEISKNKEIYSCKLPEATDKVGLILSALIPYDTTRTALTHEMYLRKEVGEAARYYFLEEHDRFAIADYMVTKVGEAPVKDNLLVVDPATGFYKELAKETDVSGYGFVAVIEEIEYKSNLTLVRVRVIKNEDVA